MEGTDTSRQSLVWWIRGAAATVLVVTVFDWLGWTFGIRPFAQVSSQWPQMTPWTAALLSGSAIAILLQVAQSALRLLWAGRAVAVATGAVALVFLAEYATGRPFGLDQTAFFGTPGAGGQSWPGRPAAFTALSILMLAATVTLMRLDRRWSTRAWPFCAVLAVALPLVTLLTYLFDAAEMLSRSLPIGMKSSTAVAIALLAVATLATRPDRQPVAWLVARPDRRMLVRLVATFILVPIWVAIWRLLLLLLGLRGEAVWVLSVTLATLILGIPFFVISRRVQRLMFDQLKQSRLRAEAEHERADAVERYRILAENAVDVVVHLRGNEMAWASPSIEAAFGWPVHDWVGADFSRRIHPDDLEVVFEALARIFAGRATVERFRVATADGGYRWVEGHGKPYTDVEGSADGVIVAVRLIDTQVEVELELQRALDFAIGTAEAGLTM